MTVTEPEPMSRRAAAAYAIGLPLALIALVFLPVGRLDWSPGWVFISFLIIVYGASALILALVNPVIYRARSRFQPGTKHWDRILLLLMLPAMIAEIPLADCTARSCHPEGVNVRFMDGGVRFIRDSIDPQVWRGLATRSGGETIGEF